MTSFIARLRWLLAAPFLLLFLLVVVVPIILAVGFVLRLTGRGSVIPSGQ